jgi:hypothetical protein
MRTALRRPLNSPQAQPLKGEQPMNTNAASEYRNLPLAVLTESVTNPRRIFEDSALKELADFVPGHKIGQFVERLFIECTARVEGALDEVIEWKVAILASRGGNCVRHTMLLCR